MSAPIRCFNLTDPDYPARLRELERPPSVVEISGELDLGKRAIAVVGSRKPTPEAAAFARELARTIVRAGAIVASGGALGIDSAVHEGAVDAGGVTWVVNATGRDHQFPPENEPLVARVVQAGGVMIWPFARHQAPESHTFLSRNGVLVALADALVIVQAALPSGTMNAASWAKRLDRPFWAACCAPWTSDGARFAGCAWALTQGARPLFSVESWLGEVGLAGGDAGGRASAAVLRRGGFASPRRPARRARPEVLPLQLAAPQAELRALTDDELAVVGALADASPVHIDEIAAKSRLSAQAVRTALLTLALENVVVESPEGFYRRTNRH